MKISIKKAKSFTFVELIVTISIMSILAVISFGMFAVYQRKATIDTTTQELKNLILKTQSYAFAPDSSYSDHYLIVINGANTPRTYELNYPLDIDVGSLEPHFVYEDKCNCRDLEADGGYCIVRLAKIDPVGALKSGINTSGENPPGSPIVVNTKKVCLQRGVITKGKDVDIKVFPSSTVTTEQDLFKIHFRTMDGKIGFNGFYSDVNLPATNRCDECDIAEPDDIGMRNWCKLLYCKDPDGDSAYAYVEITSNGEVKSIRINPWTGELSVVSQGSSPPG